jgi:hypothetical protein
VFSRIGGLVLLVCIVAAGSGYLVAAGAMPWPVPVAAVAVALVIAGLARSRRRRPPLRSGLLDDTEPAFVKPPGEE